MEYTIQEVIQFVEENDVKFVRLGFCDISGTQKNIAIMASELGRAFESGILFDAAAIYGTACAKQSDLVLYPDPGTMAILPWRPGQGRVLRFFCDIRNPDGTPFWGDGRTLLRNAAETLQQEGYQCKIGPECEFYLFELDEKGYPTLTPHDKAGYLEIAPRDRGENVRREICLTLEEMGIQPESSHHEQGPGQNEIDFKYSGALHAADNLITFKNAVKTISARNGLHASFMPKPLRDKSGSGLHINLSIYKNGLNLFNQMDAGLSGHFMAGILNRLYEITAFLNPLTNSYARFGSYEAPGYIAWSPHNRSVAVRIPAVEGEYSRMELRSPDPACNPYIAFTLLIRAGLEGITEKMRLEDPVQIDTYNHGSRELPSNAGAEIGLRCLPCSLAEAIQAADSSAFVKRILPEQLLSQYLILQKEQQTAYSMAQDPYEFELRRYFETV